jgi:hypothetical protein
VYRRRWLADVALATSGAVCLLVEPSSITLHSIFGLVFAAAVGPHLWYRRVWIRGAVRRLWRRRPLPAVMRWNLSQALLLLALVAAVTWSGIADWLQVGPRLVPHGLSAVLLIVIVVRHTWTRRHRMLPRRLRGRSGTPGGPGRSGPPAGEHRASAGPPLGGDSGAAVLTRPQSMQGMPFTAPTAPPCAPEVGMTDDGEDDGELDPAAGAALTAGTEVVAEPIRTSM